MPPTATRRSRPYAFVFQLGKDARVGKKKLPAALTSSLCFFYRTSHEPLAAELDAIAEIEVSEADAELMFTAVESTIADQELQEELYDDAELAAGAEGDEKSGFHAGGDFERCKAALERGGFVVEELLDEATLDQLTPAQAVDRAVQELERHLDLTSLPLALTAITRGTELPWHAGEAASLVATHFEEGRHALLVKRVLAASGRWPVEVRDALIVMTAFAARELRGTAAAQARAFASQLGEASHPAALRWLTSEGVVPSLAPPPGPKGSPAPAAGRGAPPGRPRGRSPERPKGRTRR